VEIGLRVSTGVSRYGTRRLHRRGQRKNSLYSARTDRRIRFGHEAPIDHRATNATGQFEIADECSPQEVAELIRRLGYEPVWKDWDAALTVNAIA